MNICSKLFEVFEVCFVFLNNVPGGRCFFGKDKNLPSNRDNTHTHTHTESFATLTREIMAMNDISFNAQIMIIKTFQISESDSFNLLAHCEAEYSLGAFGLSRFLNCL